MESDERKVLCMNHTSAHRFQDKLVIANRCPFHPKRYSPHHNM